MMKRTFYVEPERKQIMSMRRMWPAAVTTGIACVASLGLTLHRRQRSLLYTLSPTEVANYERDCF